MSTAAEIRASAAKGGPLTEAEKDAANCGDSLFGQGRYVADAAARAYQGRRADQVSFSEIVATCCAGLVILLVPVMIWRGDLRASVLTIAAFALVFIGSAVIVGAWLGIVNRVAARIDGSEVRDDAGE